MKEMWEALKKAKENIKLTIDDIATIHAPDLLEEDKEKFNLLDWAIAHHNYDNINFLTSKYIHPNNCKINCFERLFRGVIGGQLNKENIEKITTLLIEKGCIRSKSWKICEPSGVSHCDSHRE